ncbi:Ig-like domain-containing protein [Aquimonas voraii]|uniref:Cadherin domain-containing protein n=1 Tax=Aquimonas voraii TaxID=265719 RepID=A0A1G6ZX41_9GAMM|nr:Ig-like domain-containing protein [Aquimonas voraii]SDE06807.1 Cadherin domain-containing protein [Aquimonas voraii]
MKIDLVGHGRRVLLSSLLALAGAPLAAHAYSYSVLIDSDNDPATGCSVSTPDGSVTGIDARLDASVSFDPLQVQSQSVSRCSGGSFGAPESVPAGHPVGVDRGPGATDVVELGVARGLLGDRLGSTWRLTFLASSPLLGATDAAGPVLGTGLGLPPPVPRPAVIPAAGAGALILLCLALGLAAAWTLRRHPGLMLAALMLGAVSSAGVAWAAGYRLDGEIGDWDATALLTDPAGDTTQAEPQVDLRGVYAASEGNSVFFRFDVAEMRLPVLVPSFLNSSFSVDENSANGTVVGSINAAPGGLSSLLRFALSAQSPSAGFSVDSASGEIRIADSSQLDFETRPSFSLDVLVTLQGAPGFSLNRTVTVTLNDRNEAPQIAAQSFSVFENAASGTVVGSVVATDVDAGANGQLGYSVVGGSGQTVFAINASSGQITVANAAALNLAASPYSLQVQVSDGGAPALTAAAAMSITVNNVNDAPSFSAGPSPVVVLEDSAPYSQNWATAISDGDGGTQTLSFEFSGNSNPGVFATPPAISPTGVLSFTLAPNANGSADLDVRLRDNGGTANGGVDVSPVVSFRITSTPVNDAPGFTIPASAPPVLEGAGPQTVAAFATAISAGPADEAGQTLSFAANVTASTGNLSFAVAPALAPNGTLSYTPQAGTSGTATVSVVLSDNGGTANGGVDSSAPQSFTIAVNNVNDAPSFTPGPSPIAVLEDSGAYSAAWASNLNDNDGGIQTLSFVVLSNSNPGLFSTGPAISPTGVLSFTPAANANGVATLSLALRDNGGTANGGIDQSAPVSLVLDVTAVNDAPSFNIPASSTPVFQDAGPTVQAGFATAISRGPVDEAGQALSFALTVTGSTGNLAFAQAPAIDPATGNLSFAAQNGTSGTATVSVVLNDDGGTANGGVASSAAQVFTIEVVNVNDAPSFTPGASPLVVGEDSGAYSASWATAISDNDGGTQTLSFELTAGAVTGGLSFSTPPSISPSGVLSFTPAADSNGSASFSVVLRDSGGTAFGGSDVSPAVPLVIEVQARNDAPSFTIPASAPSVVENAGAQTVAGFATGMSPGPADEAGQTVNFLLSVTGSTGNLAFSAPPSIDPATGTLSYTPAADSFGVATVSVRLQDNGGTANGGIDTSAAQTFTLEVLFVNNAPVFSGGGNVTVSEDSAPYNAVWATAIDDGDAGISQTLSFVILSNDNPGLFTASPGINATSGNLSFQPAANANGVANLSVRLQDNGGTANGGVDTSTTVNFSITVTPLNDPPTVTPPTNVAVHRHIGIAIGSANAASLLANVSDVDGAGGAPFSVTVQTNALTAQGGRVSTAADGSWSYAPPASETGSADSFNFEVCDAGVPAPAACTTATATVALSGEAIWFVDDDAPASGDGTLARPFQTLSAAVAAASANAKIFQFSGAYSGGVTLKNGQQLIGQGASGVFDAVFGISPPTTAVARPSLGGARPQITTVAANTAGITLGSGNSVRGIEIGNTTGVGLLGTGVGSLSLGENRIVGSGQALDLANGSITEVGGSAFSEVSSSSGSSNVRLASLSGNLTLGSGALSGASGPAFVLEGGASGQVNYGGNLTKTTAGPLLRVSLPGAAGLSLSGNLSCTGSCGSGSAGLIVENRTGGTYSFSGSSKVFSGSGSSPGLQLTNNSGATLEFSGGGLAVSTSTGTALLATGAGPSAASGGTLGITGSGNTLTTTGGTALNMVDTTIGAAGLVFERISSGAGSNVGILLDNTGTSGGLNVTGSGSAGSGGTIANKSGADGLTTGNGIVLLDTANVALRWMQLNDFSNSGIVGRNVSGFTLRDSVLGGVIGDNTGVVEGPINFGLVTGANGLQGSGLLRNLRVSGGVEHNLEFYNQSGSMNLTIDGDAAVSEGANPNSAADDIADCRIDGAGVDGIQIETRGSSTSVISIQRCLFRDNASQAVQHSVLENALSEISIDSSVARRLTAGNEGFLLQNGGNARLTARLTNNRLNQFGGASLFVGQVAGNANDLGANTGLTAIVRGNTINAPVTATNHSLIVFLTSTIGQTSRANVLVENNTIDHPGNSGTTRPFLVDTPDASTTPSFTARIVNNVVTGVDAGLGNTADVTARRGSGCFDIRGNSVTGPFGLRARQAAPATVQLERGVSGSSDPLTVLDDNHPPGTVTSVLGTLSPSANGTCLPAPL